MHPAVETYDTWLQLRPSGEVDVHCGANAWTPERLLLAAIELATCRQFLREAEQRHVTILAYESNALARVRMDVDRSTLLDVTLSLHVGVKTPADARNAEQIIEELAEEPLLGVALHSPRQLKAVVEVLSEGRRHKAAWAETRREA